MRIPRTLAAAAALAVAACGQRPAAAPGPVAERDFEYVASNQGRTECAVSYVRAGDTTSVALGKVAPRGRLEFTLREPEGGAKTLLLARCGDAAYTRELRPRRRLVSIGQETRNPRLARQPERCRADTGYNSRDPECAVPAGSERNATTPTRRNDPREGGNGAGSQSPPPVAEPPREP
ncbi:MAG TPA: hypothetical protein VFR81_21130 [Longimicrobium sp.]|nr:hypothetical protein [Longimicrobium sp.]